MARRQRTRSLPLAELRQLVPAMDEHLSRFVEPKNLPPTGRVWFARDGRITSCEVRERKRYDALSIRHSMRFR